MGVRVWACVWARRESECGWWRLSSERPCQEDDGEHDELGQGSKDNTPPWVPVRPLCRLQGDGGDECCTERALERACEAHRRQRLSWPLVEEWWHRKPTRPLQRAVRSGSSAACGGGDGAVTSATSAAPTVCDAGSNTRTFVETLLNKDENRDTKIAEADELACCVLRVPCPAAEHQSGLKA